MPLASMIGRTRLRAPLPLVCLLLVIGLTAARPQVPSETGPTAPPARLLNLPPLSALPEFLRGDAPETSAAPSIETALSADGRVRAGVSGSFSSDGYTLSYGPDGSPRFVAAGAAASTGYAAGFGSNALSGTVTAIAVSGTDVYVGGAFTNAGGVAEADRVAKWDGSAWTALGSGIQSTVSALAVSGTDVYVGGAFSCAYSSGTTCVNGTQYLAKWNGSAWTALGSGIQSTVSALAVSGTDVYVGGAFSCAYSSGTTCVPGTTGIAKWNGSEWTALGGGTNYPVSALAVSGTDVYVGGRFSCAYSSGTCVPGTQNIAKWNGSAWTALGGGTDGVVSAIAVSGTDVYVGGTFNCAYSSGTTCVDGTLRIAKWDGSAWTALGGGTFSGGVSSFKVNAIAVSGTEVYVGGTFACAYSSGTTCVDGTRYIAKWDGSAWTTLGGGTFGGGTSSTVSALAVSGTDVYVGGIFLCAYSSGTTCAVGTRYIAKWDGGAWASLQSTADKGLNNSVSALAVSGTDVYVGGAFTDAGGVAEADFVAKWNGSAWTALGGGTDGVVSALAVSGTDVYVGGRFSCAYSSGTTCVDGTLHIAKWDGSTWTALGGGLGGGVTGGGDPAVRAIAVSGTDVYAGGYFLCAYSSGTCAVGVRSIAKWDGSAWTALGGGISDNGVYVLAASGTDVYVGGPFNCAYSSGTTCVRGTTSIAKWDGSAWTPLGGGANSLLVYALAVSGTDVYVGGAFSCVYSISTTCVPGTQYIAKWNGSAWTALGGGTSGGVYALAVSGTDVYVGGSFFCAYASGTTCVPGTSRPARWDGSAWTALKGGLNNSVFALAPAGTRLYLGGAFSATTDGTVIASRFTYYDGEDATTDIGAEAVARGLEVSAVSPNPASGFARIVVAVGTAQSVRVGVYDMLGRQVATVFEGRLGASARQEVSLPVGTLPAGLYVVRVEGEGAARSRLVTVVR